MIIPEKDLQTESSKLSEVERERARSSPDLEDELPPAYGDHVQDAPVSSGSSATTPHNILPHDSKPTNFLTLTEKDSAIKGNYVIDPRLQVPENLLSPLMLGQTEEERKNLYLHTRDGTIDINIWLVGPNTDAKTASPLTKRTTMRVSSNDGAVTVRVNSVDFIDPFLLEVFARDGRVTVLLPQSFHGPLFLKARHGGYALSDGLLRNSTCLGTAAEGTIRYFVGDFSAASESLQGGDKLMVETRDGKIKVRYVDEIDTCSKGGFFSRMFSK
ncbi:hypothetical protein BS17DRAFT_759087 [Gyrodon lividus]|nr:hypothetical protein BS17DRAFT_759087 [Gyrodon lividus]